MKNLTFDVKNKKLCVVEYAAKNELKQLKKLGASMMIINSNSID